MTATSRRGTVSMRHRYTPYAMLAPLVVLFVAFFAYPLVRSIWLSFHTTTNGRETFVGTANYQFLLGDRVFWWAVANTILYTILYLAVQVPACLALAMLLNTRRLKWRGLFQLAFFGTYLVGPVFAGTLFSQILSPRDGPLVQLLSTVFQHPIEIGWTTDRRLSMAAMLLANWWLSVGTGMIYCTAALRTIDPALYDAAAIDGAGRWNRFWHVTLPGVRPVLAVLVFIGAVSGLQLFELPVLLFGGPGPGFGALTIVMYLFNTGFETGNIGMASAVGWVLVAMTAGVSVAAIGVIRHKVTR